MKQNIHMRNTKVMRVNQTHDNLMSHRKTTL